VLKYTSVTHGGRFFLDDKESDDRALTNDTRYFWLFTSAVSS
jgi:hypothetical protein